MADTVKEIQPVDQISQLTNLIGLVKGKPASTTTTSSNISNEGVNALLQQILQSNQGLAAIASGQKTAGVYGSPTNQMLMNDLLTRATAEVEKQRAGTTTTQKTAGALSPKQTLGLLALTQGAKYFDKKKGGDGGIESILKNAWSAISGIGSPAVMQGSPGVLGTSDALMNYALSLQAAPTLSGGLAAEGILQSGAAGASGLESAGTFAQLGTAGDITSTIGTITDNMDAVNAFNEAFSSGASTAGQTISTIGSETGAISAAAAGAEAAGTAASTASWGGSWLGYLGSALDAYGASQTNKDYRRAVGGAILNYFGAGAATPFVDAAVRPVSDKQIAKGYEYGGVGGSFMAEPLGTIFSGKFDERDVFSGITDPANLFGGNPGGSIGSVAGFAADPIGASLGGEGVAGAVSKAVNKWVICTELNKQGLLDDRMYAASALRALNLSPELMIGYHYWAVPAVELLRKSPRLSKLVAIVARARCKHLLGDTNFLGKLTVTLGEPFCEWLGTKNYIRKAVNQKSWETLYAQH